MELETTYVDVPIGDATMRTLVAAPANENQYPGIVFYSDIFQLTPSTTRWVKRLASYGFVVAAPEIYYRIEPAGTVLEFDDEGKTRGQADVDALTAAQFDEDITGTLEWLGGYSRVTSGPLGVAGHCTGGHIGFRAALSPAVAATALWYPTGLQNGKLGADADAGSLDRASAISGELLMIFGARDPHTPAAERAVVRAALDAAGTTYEWAEFNAEHAFARDVGPRWNPAATDDAFAQTVAFFTRTLE